MNNNGERYNFSLFTRHTWHDIWHSWFWSMWGIRQTCKYIVIDTLYTLRAFV